MTLLQQFIATVYSLAIAARWSDLQEYLSLTRALLSTPTITLVPGEIKDKDV